jgi:hypothetical protein
MSSVNHIIIKIIGLVLMAVMGQCMTCAARPPWSGEGNTANPEWMNMGIDAWQNQQRLHCDYGLNAFLNKPCLETGIISV